MVSSMVCPITNSSMKPWLEVPCDFRDPKRRPGPYRLYWCNQSGFGQCFPRPTEFEARQFYEVPDYYTHTDESEKGHRTSLSFHEKIIRHIAWRLDRGRPLTAEQLAGFVLSGCKSLCDVGCGGGAILKTARDVGFDRVVGIDPDPRAAAFDIQGGIEVLNGTAESIPAELGSETFDVVVMSHVLEHTIDPLGAMSNARKLLAPGGISIIEVPNNEAQGLSIAGNCWPWLDVPRHLNFFTARSLELLCRRFSLEPITVEFVGFCRQFCRPWQSQEEQIGKVFNMTGRRSLNMAKLRMVRLVRSALSASRFKYDSVRVIARRNQSETDLQN